MEKILNENTLKNLKSGDKIYQVELTSDGGEMELVTHELIFDKYLDKKDVKIKELTISDESVLAEVHTEKAPKIPIKTDISCGYFLSEKEASWEFVNMIKIVYKKALSEYESKFGKFKAV
jgi:hypothetical protein